VGLPLSYSLRNVGARRGRTLMTAGVVALVVVACSLFLGLISSLKRTLVSTGDARNIVVMRKGSDNDGSSQLTLEAYQAIRFFDGIARDAQDQPLASPELVVQPSQPRPQLGPDGCIQRSERLVEQQHLRLYGERTRQRHPLALAAGQLRRPLPGPFGQADQRE